MGEFEEVYNGPGAMVWEAAGKPMKNGQRQISLSKLRALNLIVKQEDCIEEGVVPLFRTVLARLQGLGFACMPRGSSSPASA